MTDKLDKFSLFEEDMEILQKLGDNPNSDDGLNEQELKEKFDEAGIKIKAYLRETIAQLNGLVDYLNRQNDIEGNVMDGGTMLGALDMNGFPISGLKEPTENDQAANKGYVDVVKNLANDAKATAQAIADNKVSKNGDTMDGVLNLPSVVLRPVGNISQSCRWYDADGKYMCVLSTSNNNQLQVLQYAKDTQKYEYYRLPVVPSDLAQSAGYTIFTTKEIVPVANGGTGVKTLEELKALVNIGVDLDLLWTNASTTSTFAAQTISKNLGNYCGVLIIVLDKAGSSIRKTNIVIKNGNNFALSAPGSSDVYRRASATDGGVVFEGGKKFASYGATSAADDNNVCVPYRIFGIKGVI